MDNDIFSIRLRQLREILGLRRTEFAFKLGVPRTSLINYEKGTSLPVDFLILLKEKFNVNIDWFLTGNGEIFLSKNDKKQPEKHPLIRDLEAMMAQNLENIEKRLVILETRLKNTELTPESADTMYVSEPEPDYDDDNEKAVFVENIAAGRPIYQSDDQSRYINVPKRYIKTRPEDYYVGRIKGTSMTAAGIPDGCLALFRVSDTPRDGAIQVVEHQGEATLKRMREIPGKGWKICFEDHSGRFIDIGPGDEFYIQGDFVAVLPESEDDPIRR
jgi:SOS-response transcriptional repressor LexA/DNA-binding XRE family transcriptional regulator